MCEHKILVNDFYMYCRCQICKKKWILPLNAEKWKDEANRLRKEVLDLKHCIKMLNKNKFKLEYDSVVKK